MQTAKRHFIQETDFQVQEIQQIFELSHQMKRNRRDHPMRPLDRQSWGMLFFKNSTRTRISFDVGIHELGGHGIYLDQNSMQISRGESIADTAKVVSRYLHGLVIRAFSHSLVEEFARQGSIPIINALTDFLHPCQIYADLFSIAEKLNPRNPGVADLSGRKLAFLGDCGSNMSNSWILGGCQLGMEIVLCGPEAYAPGSRIRELADQSSLSGNYHFTTDIEEACRHADVIYTDVWVSMGDEAEAQQRREALAPYQVSPEAMAMAKPSTLFMHCLPAHIDEEVTESVISSPQSIVFDQAENRLHVQKAIISKLAELNQSF